MQAVNILFTVHSQFKKFSIAGNSNKYANFWNAEIDRGLRERPVNYWWLWAFLILSFNFKNSALKWAYSRLAKGKRNISITRTF
jgi:hypothetical protein